MRVLVVDDYWNQIETIARGLLLIGHDVVTTTDPDEALGLLAGGTDVRIDALLLDLSKASSPGHAAVERVRLAHPHLPVVAITGLLVTPNVRILERTGIRLLGKPFDPEQLGQVLATLPCRCGPDECDCQRGAHMWSPGG